MVERSTKKYREMLSDAIMAADFADPPFQNLIPLPVNSSRKSQRTVCKTILKLPKEQSAAPTMNPRTLFSQASALRRAAPTLITPITLRTHITFPHPDLDPSNGHTRFAVRAFNNIPSLIHAYAIVKAVESKLGTSVLNIQMPKQQDSLQPGPTIFIETLRPAKLDKPLLLEIPSPQLSSESNFLGGPSLSDVSRVLSEEPTFNSTIDNSPSGRKDAPLQFRVEVQKRKPRESGKARRTASFRSKQGGKDAAEIVKALREFDGGFFGGFEGVAEKFEAMLANHQAVKTQAKRVPLKQEGIENEEGKA